MPRACASGLQWTIDAYTLVLASLLMLAEQQAEFIGRHLGPAFKAAGLKTKIICYDHNCDKPEYPLTVLGNAEANPYVDGSAFHL